MQFRKNIESQLKLMKRLRRKVDQQLEKIPTGTFVRKQAKGHCYEYLQIDGKLINLDKHPEAREQQFHREALQDYRYILDQNLQCAQTCLGQYIPIDLFNDPWKMVQSECNSFRSEDKRHLYKDIYYRSKSELAIAVFLSTYDIEFKYEVALQINGTTIYPDFYIKRPQNQKSVIWEHFGLISNTEYRNKVYQKLIHYHEAGFNLWDNLIISFDNEDGSLNADYIDRIIQLYLL